MVPFPSVIANVQTLFFGRPWQMLVMCVHDVIIHLYGYAKHFTARGTTKELGTITASTTGWQSSRR